ncbi:MAG: ribonuclease Z [Clostridiales bacterium]|nr:ribonuclease Z [Clostridiales bacterium]
MNITFLGSDACMTAANNDSSGILINRRYLMDTGYFLIRNLKKLGIEPDEIEHIFFTHMHHDHYMALPQLLFWYLQKGKPLDKLHIYGPKQDLRRVVDLSMAFLQAGDKYEFYNDCTYPTLHELDAGDSFELDDLKLETCASFHPVTGLCWRIEEKSTGKVLSITGDTFYKPHIPKALHDCDLLVHETALADSIHEPNDPPTCLHSGINISLLTAKEANAKRLFVIHFAESRAKAVIERAAKMSDIEVVYPEPLRQYKI